MFGTLFSLISHVVDCTLFSENLTKTLSVDYWTVDRGSNSDFLSLGSCDTVWYGNWYQHVGGIYCQPLFVL
jgi:hypothetical protein